MELAIPNCPTCERPATFTVETMRLRAPLDGDGELRLHRSTRTVVTPGPGVIEVSCGRHDWPTPTDSLTVECLSEVPGHQGAKRLLEIAAAGRHSFALMAAPDAKRTAERLAAGVLGLLPVGVPPMTWAVLQPCPCGWLGSVHRECTCTPRRVERHCEALRELPFLMWGEVVAFVGEASPGETSEAIAERVAAVEIPDSPKRDDAATRLRKAAIERVHLSSEVVQGVDSVAATIAGLAHAKTIAAQHWAEAFQYRRPDTRGETIR
jgi:predicted ATPase with chaperone activity